MIDGCVIQRDINSRFYIDIRFKKLQWSEPDYVLYYVIVLQRLMITVRLTAA